MKLTPEQLEAMRVVPVDAIPNRLGVAFAMSKSKQSDACEATGIKAPQMSDLVNGRYKSVSVDLAGLLATFFGCAIEDLFPPRVSERKVG